MALQGLIFWMFANHSMTRKKHLMRASDLLLAEEVVLFRLHYEEVGGNFATSVQNCRHAKKEMSMLSIPADETVALTAAGKCYCHVV